MLAAQDAATAQGYRPSAEPVLAPCEGGVVAVTNDLPDNPLGVEDRANAAGSQTGTKVAPDRFEWLAHFRRGTITVKPSDRVKPGQALGKCGNSENSGCPRIDLHVRDEADLNTGCGQDPVSNAVDVRLDGKRFENVTWPVIRGLCVRPHGGVNRAPSDDG